MSHTEGSGLELLAGLRQLESRLWRLRGEWRSAVKYGSLFAATAGATMALAGANPYGFESVLLPFDFLQAGRVTGTIEEFRTVLQSGSYWTYLYFSLAVLALLLPVLAADAS